MFTDSRDKKKETLIGHPLHKPQPRIKPTTKDWTHNQSMGPDSELKLQPFGVWEEAPIHWTTWPGHFENFVKLVKSIFIQTLKGFFSFFFHTNSQYQATKYGVKKELNKLSYPSAIKGQMEEGFWSKMNNSVNESLGRIFWWWIWH